MANIVIKKNFVDGDKLFSQQLNNNFETIEKGINDGNKIVWQDGTEVKFKRYVTNDIDSLPILDGSIIYDTEKGRHYIDYQGKRVQVGSAGKEVLVQEEQPTEEDNKIWIDSDVVNTMGTEITNEHSESPIMGYSANYLNERLVKVSPTEPTTGEEVWIKRGKNLFNPNTDIEFTDGYRDWYGKGAKIDDDSKFGLKIQVEPNKTYVTNSDISYGEYHNLCFFNSKMVFISSDAYNTNDKTFTTPENCAYVTIALPKTYTWFELEEGSTYTSKKIYTKNDNGEYEDFGNLEKNIITVKRASNITITATSEYSNTEIPMEVVSSQVGSKLALVDGKIKIGKGVSHIKLNGNFQADKISGTVTFGLYIGVHRNGEPTTPGGIVNYTQVINGGLQSISVSPVLTAVQENDEVIMHLYMDDNGGTARIRGGYEGATSLTVEVID